MPSSLRKPTGYAARAARVQNLTGDQVVKAAAGLLHRIVLSNGGVAATLTVKDGAATLVVLNVPANTGAPVSVEFGLQCAASIVVNPSAVGVDALVVYE